MRPITLLAMGLLLTVLSSCGQQNVEISPKGAQRMDFTVPEPLTRSTVDLNNPQSVAKALGITLNGDPKQFLYEIVMTAPSSDQGMVTRRIPIRVDNLKQGSSIIYNVQGSHYEMPKVAKKHPVKKKKSS